VSHLTDVSQLLTGELGRTTEMFLAWFLEPKLSGSNLKSLVPAGKID